MARIVLRVHTLIMYLWEVSLWPMSKSEMSLLADWPKRQRLYIWNIMFQMYHRGYCAVTRKETYKCCCSACFSVFVVSTTRARPRVQTVTMKKTFFGRQPRDAEVHVHARSGWQTHTRAAHTRRRSHTLSLSVCIMFLALPLFVFAGRAKAEPARQTTTKRRKRKNSASSANSSVGTAAGKKRSPATNFSLSSQVPVSISSTRFASSCYVTFLIHSVVLFFLLFLSLCAWWAKAGGISSHLARIIKQRVDNRSPTLWSELKKPQGVCSYFCQFQRKDIRCRITTQTTSKVVNNGASGKPDLPPGGAISDEAFICYVVVIYSKK